VPDTPSLPGSKAEGVRSRKESRQDETHHQSTLPKAIQAPKRINSTLEVDVRPGIPARGEALPVVIPSSARGTKVPSPYTVLLGPPLLRRQTRLPIPIRRIDELCTSVRVDLDEVGLSLTPTDALLKSSRPIDEKVIWNGKGGYLVTREIEKLGGDSDGGRAEAYWAAKVEHLDYGISARRKDGVFAVRGLQRDQIVGFPIFRKG
jgi:hypothetical protein